ncbi:MAG: hypothetical protein QOE61_2780 [Micromonosporaceae bacterium]|jgi:DNA-binding helix-hairpin-helix protein with protein kinase domain|nr:hypothetical protein [Micromonosporaceae bacterium]
MTTTMRADDGSAIQLGEVLARAGEGTIFTVLGDPEWVAKVFHHDRRDLPIKRAKLAAMIAAPPTGAIQSDGFAVLTWPTRLLGDDGGTVGYLMPRVDTTNAVEIHSLSNPANRSSPLPSAPQWTQHATWSHLVNTAANLCLAVETVHRVDAVIGDLQERNILVNDTTRVTLVDCDSMQFRAANGQHFLCAVGRPEFTAPELAGTDLATTVRAVPSDLFALAVHVHLLLMAGNHPFLRGTWTGPGEQPDAMTLARSGQWAGGAGSALHTHPLAPPVDYLPASIRTLFHRAFTDGARNPAARPSAAEWRSALRAITVTSCARGHQVPVGTYPCPWCNIDDQRAARKAAAPALAAGPVTPTALAYHDYRGVPVAAGGGPTSRSRAIVLSVVGALVFIVILIVASNKGGNTRHTSSYTYTPTTSTVTNSRPYPSESTAEAINNASVGDCLNITSANGNVSAAYRTPCGSTYAMKRVISKYTNSENYSVCGGNYIVQHQYRVVLCLENV